MSVGSILNLLNELNKIILREPLASKILFSSMISINLVMNLHKYNILFILCKSLMSKILFSSMMSTNLIHVIMNLHRFHISKIRKVYNNKRLNFC
jgi:hypothetical protein